MKREQKVTNARNMFEICRNVNDYISHIKLSVTSVPAFLFTATQLHLISNAIWNKNSLQCGEKTNL